MRRSVLPTAVAAVAVTTLIASLATAGAAPAAPSPAQVPAAPATTQRVELITGDAVAVSSAAGHSVTSVLARDRRGIAGQFTRYRADGDQ
jgi:hypothetical protein